MKRYSVLLGMEIISKGIALMSRNLQSCSPLLVIAFMLSKLLYFVSAVLQLVLLDYLFELSDVPGILERFTRWQNSSSFLPTVRSKFLTLPSSVFASSS